MVTPPSMQPARPPRRVGLIPPLAFLLALGCRGSTDDGQEPPEPSPTPAVPAEPAQIDSSPLAADSIEVREDLGDYVAFPRAHAEIRRPEGFEEADRFDGFGRPEDQASIMASYIPGPFKEVGGGMTREQIEARGWTYLDEERREVADHPGLVLHFEQSAAGTKFEKWMLAYGDDQGTTIVTATLPARLSAEFSALLKAAVLSTRPTQAAETVADAPLPFAVDESPKLKLAHALNQTLLYTSDGELPKKSPSDPIFIVGPSLGSGAVTDRREFAEGRLRETVGQKIQAVESTEEVVVGGLDGVEILATSEAADSGTPMIVYELMLFDEQGYYLIQGLVGSDHRDEYLPEFERIARSFRFVDEP